MRACGLRYQSCCRSSTRPDGRGRARKSGGAICHNSVPRIKYRHVFMHAQPRFGSQIPPMSHRPKLRSSNPSKSSTPCRGAAIELHSSACDTTATIRSPLNFRGAPETSSLHDTNVMHIRPYIGIICGTVVGGLAIVIWMATFEPHGGVELSRYLFPLSALALERMYPAQDVPVPFWYAAAMLQWVGLGAVVDLLRRLFRRKSGHGKVA